MSHCSCLFQFIITITIALYTKGISISQSHLKAFKLSIAIYYIPDATIAICILHFEREITPILILRSQTKPKYNFQLKLTRKEHKSFSIRFLKTTLNEPDQKAPWKYKLINTNMQTSDWNIRYANTNKSAQLPCTHTRSNRCDRVHSGENLYLVEFIWQRRSLPKSARKQSRTKLLPASWASFIGTGFTAGSCSEKSWREKTLA